jgi:hypothetical protein
MRLISLAGLLLLLVLSVAIARIPHAHGISGTVTEGSAPVSGALVHLQGKASRSAQTNESGQFHLTIAPTHGDRLTATKDGYFIGAARAHKNPPHIDLQPLPARDFEDYTWVPPHSDARDNQACATCHREIYEEWSTSGHARAANGKHFLNLYEGKDWFGRKAGWSLLDEYPDGAGVCSACHAPTVPFSDPAYYDLGRASGVAAQGVHCDYCHKIKKASTSKVGLTHGRFAYELLRPENGQIFFGPLDDALRGNDVYAPFYRESTYCAPCHEGTVFGVHAYGTFSEWLEGPARRAGKSCQSCHMTPTGQLGNVAPGHGGVERDPATLVNHGFFAGSQAEMLRKALRVEIECKPQRDAIGVAVTVTAKNAGHRLPTGFPDRNLILIVEGFGADSQPLGPRNPRTVLSDLVGREWSGTSGKLYAKQHVGMDRQSPVPFWRAIPQFLDSRLRPEEPDESHYVFELDLHHVRVRLVYRRFWEAVRVSKGWPNDEIIVADKEIEISK